MRRQGNSKRAQSLKLDLQSTSESAKSHNPDQALRNGVYNITSVLDQLYQPQAEGVDDIENRIVKFLDE